MRCCAAPSPWDRTSARIGATLPHCQAVRIVIRHPFKPAPHPQHHRRLALSDDLAHDQNPAAVVGTRVASSASVRTEKRAVDRRILVGAKAARGQPDGRSGRRPGRSGRALACAREGLCRREGGRSGRADECGARGWLAPTVRRCSPVSSPIHYPVVG